MGGMRNCHDSVINFCGAHFPEQLLSMGHRIASKQPISGKIFLISPFPFIIREYGAWHTGAALVYYLSGAGLALHLHTRKASLETPNQAKNFRLSVFSDRLRVKEMDGWINHSMT